MPAIPNRIFLFRTRSLARRSCAIKGLWVLSYQPLAPNPQPLLREAGEFLVCDDSRRIVLASASPRREELLKLICPQFEVIPSTFDESEMPDDLSPRDHVLLSAKYKARDIASRLTAGLVIGSDTVVAVGDEILGKPAGTEDAKRMLRLLSGRTHQVYTGVHVVDVQDGEQGGFESTDVRFRKLTEEIIDRYVATGEPLDKAGAYAIQGRGAVLVEGIQGCFFNVVGLPVYRLSLILEEFGLDVLTC
ncbi:MAG: septum formation protein Maf [Armatimonadetes bacterium]|nr:septum formation protein Maf [Armatimonadota bacterium]